MNYFYFFSIFNFIFFQFSSIYSKNELLSIEKNDYEKYILISTVSGNLYLFNKYSGEQIWKTKVDQFIKTQNTNGSMLIPNPITGQLYIYQHNSNDQRIFTQLEHSIYEYVRQTPLFIENMLLTGSKNDYWISVDMGSGNIIHKYRTGDADNCPQYDVNKNNNRTLHMGICEYNLVVSDFSTRHIIYNVILNSLTTHASNDLEHFGIQLYGSSDSGMVVSKYKSDGIEKGWSCILDSPAIGFYGITSQGILSRFHFTTMSRDTIDQFLKPGSFHYNGMILKKSMFFGHNNNNWYVLKAYISEDKTIRGVVKVTRRMITGPMNMSYHGEFSDEEGPTTGFYEVPIDVNPANIDRRINPPFLLEFQKSNNNTALVPKLFRQIRENNLLKGPVEESLPMMLIGLMVTATFVMTFLILYRLKAYTLPRQDLISESKHDPTNLSRPSNEDQIDVGDLSYYPKEVLGYGTNGTTVYRGIFRGNNKSVAVKRLIKSDQSHYELQFLRQSFDCSYLIKCFYITQSREFTFLGLELCDCTLEGYVTDVVFQESCGLNIITACKQMMSGVHFLHDKGIVHRDLKPRNVLLMKQHKVIIRSDSKSDAKSQYKIVITDFGLSRQSLDYCSSITKTGCGGTSGYMAPELSREDIKRITPRADIFSCGILFYFIYTDGQHPFGSEILSRQHRIHQGQFTLNEDLINNPMLVYFITSMLQPNPEDRPTADEILNGPLFWKSTEKLSFLCDISDVMENADISLQISLNKLSGAVFPDNWTDNLEPCLLDNLTSQRSYKTKLLSHLIRALRNKRNHFNDLPADISENLFLGNLDGLDAYITRKFPHLYSTLYKWSRMNLLHFNNSIHHYFPSHFIKEPSVTVTDIIDSQDKLDLVLDNDFLEWRKPSRKRPNQQKKHRGSKNNKIAI